LSLPFPAPLSKVFELIIKVRKNIFYLST